MIYPCTTVADNKITPLRDLDLVFCDDLRNLHDEIDVVAANASQNSSNILSLFNTLAYYIPQTEKSDLINSAWVAPLQSDVKISGFDLDINMQEPPGVSPEDLDYLPPTPLALAIERGCKYVSNNTSDVGYEVFRLSGDDGVLFTNVVL
jgi:hypothetical protein